jgi:hypothetical protein
MLSRARSGQKPEGAPQPENSALGSPESRAAARAMLESREKGVRRIQFVSNVQWSGQDNSLPHVGDWQRCIDGGLMRFVYVPDGTDDETENRLLATP